ncbi:hypothetical protein [Phycicoccus sp.]|uniref:hypothetical protein n=1 Tax=Phycicoccus sp. TaxID=1902410 RepID=UPI002CB70714|nr:hypothetical protein [Phycicoccus sp.]HMM96704.1 hypothetical protein [Phycicoccus sp.]
MTAAGGTIELAQLVSELEAMRERAVRAEATRDAHRLEAGQLEATAGADLLDTDDPDAGERLAARLSQLRASVELQDRAATEARSRARRVEVAALRAEADLVGPQIAEAEKALADFDAKTDRFVKQLQQHTKCEVNLVSPDVAARERFDTGQVQRVEFETPPRWSLVDAVAGSKARRDLALGLADVVAGDRSIQELKAEVSPVDALRAIEWDDLPSVVRDGVVLIEGLWLAPPAQRDWQAELEALDAEIEAADERAADLERRLRSQDRTERSAAMAKDYHAVTNTPGGLRQIRSRLVADAAKAGVSVG